MQVSSLPIWEMVLSALAGGGGTKFLDFLTSRSRSKAYTMGAVDHAVQTAMTLVTDRLERVEAQHEECETNLEKVREDLGLAKAEIARLMQGPVAVYEPRPVRHD